MRTIKTFKAHNGLVALSAMLLAINATREIAPTIAAPIPAAKSGSIAPTSVTLDNFVSLEMSTSGGFANLTSKLHIGDTGEALWTANQRASADMAPAHLTLNLRDYAALFRVLNAARFPSLAGRYTQKNLADGINETVTLVLHGAKGELQKFAVENYGENAPPGFYAVTAHLRQLTQHKPATDVDEITRENLQSLTITISSSDATVTGRPSIIEFKVSGGALIRISGRWQLDPQTAKAAQLSDEEINDVLLLLNADVRHTREVLEAEMRHARKMQQVQMPPDTTPSYRERNAPQHHVWGGRRTSVAIKATWKRDGILQTFTHDYGSSSLPTANYVLRLWFNKQAAASKPQ